MKVLICGGRDIDYVGAFNWLERNLKDELAFASGCTSSLTVDAIIHGGCRGADEAAGNWAKSEGIRVVVCKANWKKHGKAAGPIRNREMLTVHKPNYVVALPGGRGTADMISAAQAADVPVLRINSVDF